MLIRLLVQNIALAERVELELNPGLSVITGETGAGKSLLIDALSLLQGARGAGDFIRTGSDSAIIEATFRLASPALRQELAEAGLETDGDEVTLRRVLNREGRHRTYVNGGQVPATLAAQVAEKLIDIHGQHEQQSLLSTAAHLELLDGAAGLQPQLTEYAARYQHWRELQAERETLRAAVQDRERRLDFVRFQLDELQKIAPVPGEWAALETERKRLENADRLTAACVEGDELLYSGDGAAAVRLRTVTKRLEEAARFDDAFTAFAAECRELAVRAEELARSLASHGGDGEADPLRLDAVHSRLEALSKLKRKYGDLDDLPRQLDALDAERRVLEDSDGRLAALEKQSALVEADLQERAAVLKRARKKAAPVFARKIEEALRPLGMSEASVEWSFVDAADLGPRGNDEVELLVSANRGEPAKPLQKVASGGELSRLMLALHTVALQAGGPECVIFDEIDAGIGGDVGNAVGQALRKVAQTRQVICVTHLAQIASFANEHWTVKKRVAGDRTVSEIQRLNTQDRQEEIGRMLSGMSDAVSRKHARALLEKAGL